jgi:2-polyprenyl-3-methyl-5-hydroxy-6-metoxy-1,4-benzoquinol methylase
VTGAGPTPGTPSPSSPTPYAARTKYDEPGRAERYRARSARRDAEERRLLHRVLPAPTPGATALDVPCGTGRLSAWLLDRGWRVVAADLSPAMREAARATLAGREGATVEAMDLDAVPDGSRRFDLVLCFRFLHHLEGAAARVRVLSALAARARGPVVVSFHHRVSVHQAARALRRLVTGRRGDRHAISVVTLARDAEAAGLRVVATAASLPYLRDLWVAVLVARR